MTLANGLIHGSKAYLWTDTAWWSPETGKLVGHDTKAITLHTWPAALVMSLHGDNPMQIAGEIGNAWPSDVDDLLGVTADALRGLCLRGGFGRILVATNLGGPRLHLIACDGAGMGAPFEAIELLSLTSSGNQTAEYKEAIERGFTPERMRRVIDAQIADPFDGEGAVARFGKRSWIGGNVVEIEVSAAGAESRVLRAVEGEAA